MNSMRSVYSAGISKSQSSNISCGFIVLEMLLNTTTWASINSRMGNTIPDLSHAPVLTWVDMCILTVSSTLERLPVSYDEMKTLLILLKYIVCCISGNLFIRLWIIREWLVTARTCEATWFTTAENQIIYPEDICWKRKLSCCLYSRSLSTCS